MQDRKGIGGPSTPEGKRIASMNALKTGKHMRHFERITGDQAGNLAICHQCGTDQQSECRQVKQCQLHKELIYRYHLSHAERDPVHIEEFTVQQLAVMDLLFQQKLFWILQNEGEYDQIPDKNGNMVEVPRVRTEHYYMLMNMAQNLSKSLPDMQLTRQTQENMDVSFSMLLQSKVDPDRAREIKEKMLAAAQEFEQSKNEAQAMEDDDAAIKAWVEQENKAGDDTGNLPQRIEPGVNPFGKNRK